MRVLIREFVIAKRKADDRHDREVTLVWLGQALRRQKKLPDLKTLLAKREVKQNHKQMRTMVHQIAEHYGLKVRTGKPVRRR